MTDERREAAIEAAAEDMCGGEHSRFGFKTPIERPCSSCVRVARAAIAAYDAALGGEGEAREFVKFVASLDAPGATKMRRRVTLTTLVRRAQGILRSTHPDADRSAEHEQSVEPGENQSNTTTSETYECRDDHGDPRTRIPHTHVRAAEHPETGERERCGEPTYRGCGGKCERRSGHEGEHGVRTMSEVVDDARALEQSYVAPEPLQETGEREAWKVEQRDVHDCLRACVATVLGLPYEDVPEFLALSEVEDRAVPWRRRLYDFLASRGLVPWEFGLHGEERPLLMFGGTPIAYNVMPPGLWIAAVQSPRIEGTHAVVMRGGQIEWDPHPQRDMGHRGFREAMIFLPTRRRGETSLPEPLQDGERTKGQALGENYARTRRLQDGGERDWREWTLCWLENVRVDDAETTAAVMAAKPERGPALLADGEQVRVIPKAEHERQLREASARHPHQDVEPIRAALEDCVKWMRRARSGNLFADEKRRAQFEASRLRGVAALASEVQPRRAFSHDQIEAALAALRAAHWPDEWIVQARNALTSQQDEPSEASHFDPMRLAKFPTPQTAQTGEAVGSDERDDREWTIGRAIRNGQHQHPTITGSPWPPPMRESAIRAALIELLASVRQGAGVRSAMALADQALAGEQGASNEHDYERMKSGDRAKIGMPAGRAALGGEGASEVRRWAETVASLDDENQRDLRRVVTLQGLIVGAQQAIARDAALSNAHE